MRLDPWGDRHTPLLVRLSAIPSVTRHIGLGHPWSPSTAEQISAKQSDHWAENGFGWRAAVEKETERQIGFMALNFVGEGTAGLEPSEYEIGWWLEPESWGRGLAQEGAEALRLEAYDRLEAPSVIARIQPKNERSARVAERLGLGFDFETTGAAGEAVRVYRGLAPG